jgi:apyrase
MTMITKRKRSSLAVQSLLLGVLTLTGAACTSQLPPPVAETARTLEEAYAASPASGDAWRYALVIDASSSATGLQIFKWRARPGGRLPQIEAAPYPRRPEYDAWEIKVRPGLSAYADNPEQAAQSLEPLMDFALEKLGTDGRVLSDSSVLLRATAGMRLLPNQQQEAILFQLRSYLDSLPFGESSARVISGEEEGVYGWIAVNYTLGHLEHGGPFPTVGALDLGGASTQITFLPLDYPRSLGRTVRIGENTYRLYTHSYLGLGQDQARESVDSTACFIRGYPMPSGGVGTGDFARCQEAILETFSAPCDDGPCSLFGAYQPPLYGEFLAFSVYAFAADFFDLGERLVPQDIAEEGAAFCSQDWNAMIAADPDLESNPYVPNYCYAAAHIATLLSDGFGFPSETDKITAPLRVQGSSVGWTLGALVYDLAGNVD